MKESCDSCRYEMAYAVQFEHLREDLAELKDRVRGLEGLLTRGMGLLIANLIGMAAVLAERVIAL